MTFMDDLTLVLDLLILVAVTVFYTGFTVWFQMSRRDRPRALLHLREGAFVMGTLGVVLGIIALWGEFTWPLNATVHGSNVLASYDLLFFDSLTLLALLLVSFGAAVNLARPTHFVGLLGLIIGSGIVYYGYRAYTLSLTQAPLETLLLYLGFGGVAILSYPVTIYVDRFIVGPSVPGVDPWPGPAPAAPSIYWRAWLGLFLLVVLLAGVAALAYGFDTAWAHLAAPP